MIDALWLTMSNNKAEDGSQAMAIMGQDMMEMILRIEGEIKIKTGDLRGLRLISLNSMGVNLMSGWSRPTTTSKPMTSHATRGCPFPTSI